MIKLFETYNTPKTVKIAVILLIVSFIITSLIDVKDLVLGFNNYIGFSITIMISSLWLLFPYFFAKGSNTARWVYLIVWIIFSIISLILCVLYPDNINFNTNLEKFDFLQMVITDIAILYLLFIPQQSRKFFNNNN